MRTPSIIGAILVAAVCVPNATSEVPPTVMFAARLVDEQTGNVITGTHTLNFQLYDAATDGSILWTESHVVTIEDGMAYVALGAKTTIDRTVLNGTPTFLGITLDGVAMEPRVPIVSVPYAIRAASADEAATLGGLQPQDFQQRVVGKCASTECIKGISADGNVTCSSVGTGDLTGLSTGPGLFGGGTQGDLSLSVDTSYVQRRVVGACGSGQFMSSVGEDGSVSCSGDAGDITDVVAGLGLIGGSSTGPATLQLDTAVTDARYVSKTGDVMAGSLDVASDLVVRGFIKLIADGSPLVGPEMMWSGNRGTWLMGIDVANNGGSRDFVLAAKVTWPFFVNDFIYLAHNDTRAPTMGVGMTPPNQPFRLQISAQDSEPEMGSLFIRRTPNQLGDLFTVMDSAGTKRWTLDSEFWLKGSSYATGASVSIKADDQFGRPLLLAKPDGSARYGFEYAAGPSDSLYLRSYVGNSTNFELTASGRTRFPNGLTSTGLRVEPTAVPTTSSSPCTAGDITYDNNYVYVCVATNSWKRSALDSW